MVYITSDLFGPVDTHNQTNDCWNTMPDSQQPGLGKRKRNQDREAQYTSRGPRPQHSSAFEHNSDHPYALYETVPEYGLSEHRPVKQLKRLSLKHGLVKSTSHLMDCDTSTDLPMGATNNQVHTHAVTDLRACHACKSAPKRKKDLENYMNCKRCDGRTCYICARQCLGACGKTVCKNCSVEEEETWDSWCLDCFQRQMKS